MRFVAPEELRAFAARELEELLGANELVVAYGAGEVSGFAAAALLFSDYAVLQADAKLVVETQEAWAAAAWRLGRATLRWALDGSQQTEIVDEVTETDPSIWLEKWMQHRSVMALDSAAFLIRSRGGDRLERAEFAKLFAAGEPQKGLSAFLAKIKPAW